MRDENSDYRAYTGVSSYYIDGMVVMADDQEHGCTDGEEENWWDEYNGFEMDTGDDAESDGGGSFSIEGGAVDPFEDEE